MIIDGQKKFLKKNAHVIQWSNYNAAAKISFFLLHVYIPILVGLTDNRVKKRYFVHILAIDRDTSKINIGIGFCFFNFLQLASESFSSRS